MSDPFALFLSRRAFLKAAGSTAILASTGCGFGDNKWEKIAVRLMDSLDHPERARMIGNLYIKATPEASDISVTQWAEETLNTLDVDPDQLTDANMSLLDGKLRKRIRRDFVDENIVIVKGYLLSKTEIMLCALAAAHAASG